MSKPISDRKLAANRRNARRSTGPKTARGKAKSRQNAVRHGILATQLLVGEGREDQDAYEKLQRQLRAEEEPIGVVEELLVAQLGDELWRLHQRVNRAEGGAIRKRWDALEKAVSAKREQQTDQFCTRPLLGGRTSLNVELLVQEIDEAIEQLRAYDPTATEPPGLDLSMALRLEIAPFIEGAKGRGAEDTAILAGILEGLRERLTREKQAMEEREADELNVKGARCMVPRPNEMDSLLRYKTSSERSIQRILNQLEKRRDARRNRQPDGQSQTVAAVAHRPPRRARSRTQTRASSSMGRK